MLVVIVVLFMSVLFVVSGIGVVFWWWIVSGRGFCDGSSSVVMLIEIYVLFVVLMYNVCLFDESVSDLYLFGGRLVQ